MSAASWQVLRRDLRLGSPEHRPSKLGPYRIEGVLGRGRFAVVYDARLGEQPLALKVLRENVWRPEDLLRFAREARLVSSLSHPTIVRVFGTGAGSDEEGRTHRFIALERIDGGSLAERLLPWPAAVRLLGKVAEAIEVVHERGILHRDLTPRNILLDRRGEPRITDFGLAKPARNAEALTRSGWVLGTPGYMSPEQLRGGDLDPRSDLYSLGACLYRVLTGRPPFVERAFADLYLRIQRSPPDPPSAMVPEIPPSVDEIVLCALDADPKRRYQRGGELARALAAVAP